MVARRHGAERKAARDGRPGHSLREVLGGYGPFGGPTVGVPSVTYGSSGATFPARFAIVVAASMTIAAHARLMDSAASRTP